MSDLLNLNNKSYMLRHYVEAHMGEEFSTMQFHMKEMHRVTFMEWPKIYIIFKYIFPVSKKV